MKKLLTIIAILLLSPLTALGTPVGPYTIPLPNGILGTVLGVNDRGDQVGRYLSALITHTFPEYLGFEIDRFGEFTTIGPQFGPVTDIRNWAEAVDINNSGAIIGHWRQGNFIEPVNQGFLYDDGVYTNIEFPRPSDAPCQDHETTLTAIFDNGVVAGRYRYGDVDAPCFPGGTREGTFLWQDGVFYTIPEASSWLLFGFGLIALEHVARKRSNPSAFRHAAGEAGAATPASPAL